MSATSPGESLRALLNLGDCPMQTIATRWDNQPATMSSNPQHRFDGKALLTTTLRGAGLLLLFTALAVVPIAVRLWRFMV
jgi:hypothetical protein